MSDHSLLTILHISDFHFAQRKRREQGIIVDALLADIQRICIGHRKPDLVIFSGDLVHAAGTDRHDEAYDFLLNRVASASGCSDERLFITPGNHDLSWDGLERFAGDTRLWRGLLGKADESARLNELHESRSFNAAVNSKFANYIDLERHISSYRSRARQLETVFATVDHDPVLNVDVVVFNTAVFSTGGNKHFDDDERRLAIPEYAVKEVVRSLMPDSLRIFVTHHPLGMLSLDSSRFLEGEIARSAHIHLYGHMHDVQPRTISGLKGAVLTNQAGAVFVARKDYYSGYALITFDRQTSFSETVLRSYYKDRDEFDEATDLVEHGRWWPSQQARQHFRKIASPVDDQAFRAHLLGRALDDLRARQTEIGGEGDVHDRFVAPPLRRTSIQESDDDVSTVEMATTIAFADIVAGDANLILHGRPEYGRTTLLRELRYRLLTDAKTVRFSRLPVLLDFMDIGTNVEQVLRKARSGAETLPEGHDLEALLQLGHVCVFIDDVQFGDVRRMRALRSFVQRFSKARYILSSAQSSATRLGANVNPEMPVRFEFVEILEFRRNDMRQLLEKDERCTDVEEWLDRLQAEFREINLPFTAANGSILIEILSERYNFTPVNRAVLMEQFIDQTLRKAAIEQSKRETFDYTNKTDLLSHLAAWMAKGNEYVPTKEAFRSEMKSYTDARGLNVRLDELFSEFLTARIFVFDTEERVRFRYRAVLEYFIAFRMTIDSLFRSWVLQENNYLSYINELQLYAGKLRNDSVLVELVGERHEAIMAHALADLGDVRLEQLETLPLPPDTGGGDIDVLEREIASPPLTQEEKDAELEAEIPVDGEDRQEVFRPRSDELGGKVMLSLVLYSGLVKNMELINDADKRRHLRTIWRGWSILLIASLRYAPRLAKERKVRVNGALYEIHAPQGMSDSALLRKMILLLPHIHVRMLSSCLGTEKLERQLTEPTFDEMGEPKIVDFLRTSLITDLRLDATPNAVAKLIAALRGHSYLLWSFVVHLGELRRLDRVKSDHFKKLTTSLAGAIADLKGGSFKTREDERRRQLARLAKDRLMLTLRRDR